MHEERGERKVITCRDKGGEERTDEPTNQTNQNIYETCYRYLSSRQDIYSPCHVRYLVMADVPCRLEVNLIARLEHL
jgi:hypothetical protein